MAIEKKLIRKAISDHEIREYIRKEMDRAGVSQVILQKTPMATRIILYVRRPGIVVGKRGSSIKDLCDKLTERFKVDNPQLDVVEVENPSLDAALMAEKIGKQIELRGNVKQTIRFSLKDIMEAGAVGAEIRVAGKIVGKGGKAKTLKISSGHLKKSGDIMHLVPEGRYVCYLKAGTIGIRVKIVPPKVKFPDAYDYAEIDGKLDAMQKPEGAETAAAAVEKPSEELDAKIEEKLSQAKEEKKEKPAEKKQPAKKAPAAKKPATPKKKEEKAEEKPAEGAAQ